MNLIVDIGNTKTKLAVFDGQSVLYQDEFDFHDEKVWVDLFEKFSINSYIVSSVKSENAVLYQSLKDKCSKGIFLNSETPLPFIIDYEIPKTLGQDRVALAAGAFVKYPNTTSLIISCGTCITYNLITHDGKFIGGGISPGVHMRLKAMHHFTDKLPLVDWDGQFIPELIAKNTTDALLSGAVNGVLSELNEVIKRYRQTFTRELNIILSGGDAKFFEKELKNSIFADSNFVLYGLNEILQYNS